MTWLMRLLGLRRRPDTLAGKLIAISILNSMDRGSALR